ncbi:MAG: kelch repeat-containing protein [Candidatus Dormibacteria bacterium]
MADGSEIAASAGRRRARSALVAVGLIAVAGAGAGAYLGLRGAHSSGSGLGDTPSARAYAAAAYDEARKQVVLFGGSTADGTTLGDTWTWDGSTWSPQHPSVTPPARSAAAMSYDPSSRDVLLFGGRDSQKSSVLTDTWEWDGSNWHATARSTPSGPGGPAPSMATDPTTGQVILLTQQVEVKPLPVCLYEGPGGPASSPLPAPGCPSIQGPGTLHAYVWSGAEWTTLAAQPQQMLSQIAYGAAVLVADPGSAHLLLLQVGGQVVCPGAQAGAAIERECPLGGNTSDAAAPSSAPLTPCCFTGETRWDGAAWAQHQPAEVNGPATTPSEVAADTSHRAVVAYAGQSTWTRTAGAWTELHPSPSPGLVSGSTVVYDGAIGRVLLFGGMTSAVIPVVVTPVPVPPPQVNPAYSNELWSWDGTTWTQIVGETPTRSPSPSPSPSSKPSPSPPPSPSPVNVVPPASSRASPLPTFVPPTSAQPIPCTPIAVAGAKQVCPVAFQAAPSG